MANPLDFDPTKPGLGFSPQQRRRPKFTEKEFNLHYGAQKGKCGICGKRGTKNGMGLDHIIPINKGGSDRSDNLHAVHSRCNSRKGTKDLDQVRKPAARKGRRSLR